MITTATALVGPTILFVDDEPKLCLIVSRILGEDGYNVVTAENGPDALAIASRVNPQIAVIDINMPIMDGITLLREMRQRGMEFPVVMLTAQGTIATAREAMELGAFDYMTKPFDLQLFKETLQDALTGRSGIKGS
jgi:DNA-binding NtrC family response regulator